MFLLTGKKWAVKLISLLAVSTVIVFLCQVPCSALPDWGCCQNYLSRPMICKNVNSKEDCFKWNKKARFYPGLHCLKLGPAESYCGYYDTHSEKWVYVGKFGHRHMKPIYHTGTDSACGARQYAAYNYPVDAPDPNAPQLALVDSAGNPITALHTERVTNPSLIGAATQLYQDSGWASLNDTVVIWAFGTLPLEGGFPGTFCYGADEYYDVISNAGIPPAIEDTIVGISWYSADTMSVPDSIDFIAMAVLPPRDIPTLTEWGLIMFGLVLLGFITWVFLKRRKVIGVRA